MGGTPRKLKSQHSRPQPVQNPSDLESDQNNHTDLCPPPLSRSSEELNLSVLRRLNPAVHSILSIAPYAVVYLFSVDTQQWEKSGVEGTLFVCQLSAEDPDIERYAVIVLNRRGLENFTAELVNGGDVEITDDYVILRVAEGEEEQRIYGLWIFAEPLPASTAKIRAINAQVIQERAIQAETSRSVAAQKRLAQETEAYERAAEEDPVESLPMERHLSLRELFGQQREQDSGWSVRNHAREPSSQAVPSGKADFPATKVGQPQPFMQRGAKEQRSETTNHPQGHQAGRDLLALIRNGPKNDRAQVR